MFRFFKILILITLVMSLVLLITERPWTEFNYWNNHGILLLGFLALFPRLTLLFSSIPFGGLFWWLGFIFCPRYLIAILATLTYWPHNYVLVTFAWLVALGGEGSEKYMILKRVRRPVDGQIIDVEYTEV